MSRIVTGVCISFFLLATGCKKTIDKIKEDRIVAALTDGQWAITSFSVNGTDITGEFTNYKFQYYNNRTVDATKDGTVERSGTWDGNMDALTTWANFPNSVNPILLLNGTWHIDNNSWTFAVLAQSNGSEIKNMRLEKL